MINALLEKMEQAKAEELERALEAHGEFNSRHEAWAHIVEEYEEAYDELEDVYKYLEQLKVCVFLYDIPDDDEGSALNGIIAAALRGAAEMIQVAVVAEKHKRITDEQ